MIVRETYASVTDCIDRLGFSFFAEHAVRLSQNVEVSIRSVNWRRLSALTLALVVTLPLSALAADWQWNRHVEREARNQLISTNREKTLSLDDVLQRTPVEISQLQYSRVEIQGEFVPGSQVAWRRQILNGQPGFIVLARFNMAGKELLVARGWVAAAGSIPDPNLDLALPIGLQVIDTRIRQTPEAEVDPSDLPTGQTNSVGTQTTLPFYLEQTTAAEPLITLPDPVLEAGPHLGYVGQWILIGLTGLVAYIMILRRGYASETKSA